MISKSLVGKIGLVLGPALFVAMQYYPIEGMAADAKIVLGLTLWMSAWWITQTIPIYITALLPLVVFPLLNVLGIDETATAYADPIIFLFLGGFMLAKAVEKSKLHERFALNILKISGTKPKYVVGAFMAVTGFLSAWMSNTATTILMLPIALAVISQVGNPRDQSRFSVCLLLSIAYSASIGGMATLIGTPPNAIFASLSSSTLGIDVNFAQWMLVGVPVSAVSLVAAWWYMVNVGARIGGVSIISGEKGVIRKKLSELGGISRDEKMVAGVFVATAVAWITRGLLWGDLLPMIDDSTIVLISVISLFLLPSSTAKKGNDDDAGESSRESDDDDDNKRKKLLGWHDAVKIPWGVLLLIGGGLALAGGFIATGLDDWVVEQLSFLGGMNYLVIVIIIVAATVFASEIGSNTSTAALFIPISASLAASFGMDPILLMVPITIASSFGFMMPVATPPNAIVFASGHVTVSKMVRAGLPLNILGIIIVSLLTTLLVPLVWG